MYTKKKEFQKAIIASGILHLILLTIFFFGIPSMFEKLPEEQNVMSFEMVSVEEFSNIKTQDTVPQKSEDMQKSREVKKSTTVEKTIPLQQEDIKPTKENEQTPAAQATKESIETPKTEVEKETPPIKKEEVKQEAPIEPQKTETQKTEEKKEPLPAPPIIEQKKEQDVKPEIQPKQTAPKSKSVADNTKKAAKKEDSIDSILKNIEEESKGTDAKAPAKNINNYIQGKIFSQGGEYNEESPLSITEKMLIKNQIQKHWTPPAGANSLSQIRILIKMALDKTGKVKAAEIIGIYCPKGAEAACSLTAQTAIRAVWKASPLVNLPIDRYDIWKEIKLYFDPSFLAQ